MNLKKLFTKKKTLAISLAFGLITCVAWTMADEKINYLTEPASVGEIKKTVNATGEVAAIELVSVGAQVSGQIEHLNVKLGQYVRKGDLIAKIDSRSQQSELDINKATLKSYEAQLESAKANLKARKNQFDRANQLEKERVVSKENFEDVEKSYIEAKARVSEIEAMIEKAKIAITTGEINLGYTTILAPFDGTVVSIPVKEGQTVNANQYTPTIVQMANLSEMAILIQISEGDVTKIRPDMEVTYSILSEPDEIYTAKLVTIDPGLTTLTNGAYTGIIDANTPVYYYGRAIAENTEGKLYIGMTTQNEIIIEARESVLKIPTLAIHEDESKNKFTDILEKGRPVRKEIKTGLSDSMYTEVMEGLKEGDLVISAQTKNGEIVNAVDLF